MRRAARYGVGTDLIQVDAALPTGFVRVAVDDAGNPDYEILAPSAWDAIAPTDALLSRAADARAIVFGTLAQRHAISRGTIERLWDTKALMVFDVNLRPPFDDREIVRRSLRRADVVKISDHEMRQVAQWFDLRGSLRETVLALAESSRVRSSAVLGGAVARCSGARGSGANIPASRSRSRIRWVPGTRFSRCCSQDSSKADRTTSYSNTQTSSARTSRPNSEQCPRPAAGSRNQHRRGHAGTSPRTSPLKRGRAYYRLRATDERGRERATARSAVTNRSRTGDFSPCLQTAVISKLTDRSRTDRYTNPGRGNCVSDDGTNATPTPALTRLMMVCHPTASCTTRGAEARGAAACDDVVVHRGGRHIAG